MEEKRKTAGKQPAQVPRPAAGAVVSRTFLSRRRMPEFIHLEIMMQGEQLC